MTPDTARTKARQTLRAFYNEEDLCIMTYFDGLKQQQNHIFIEI